MHTPDRKFATWLKRTCIQDGWSVRHVGLWTNVTQWVELLNMKTVTSCRSTKGCFLQQNCKFEPSHQKLTVSPASGTSCRRVELMQIHVHSDVNHRCFAGWVPHHFCHPAPWNPPWGETVESPALAFHTRVFWVSWLCPDLQVGDFAILLRAGFDRWSAARMQLSTASFGVFGACFALCAHSPEGAGETGSSVCVLHRAPFTADGNSLPKCLQRMPPPGYSPSALEASSTSLWWMWCQTCWRSPV